MRETVEDGEHLRTEIDHIDVQEKRRIRHAERINGCLGKCRFARIDNTADQMIHTVGEINADIHLRLILRCVSVADNRLQLETSGYFRPFNTVKYIIRIGLQAGQIQVLRERRQPEFPDLPDAGCPRSFLKVIHDRLKLRYGFELRKMYSPFHSPLYDLRRCFRLIARALYVFVDLNKVIDPHAVEAALLEFRVTALNRFIKLL